MTESEYLEKLNQVDFDLTFLKKRLRTLDFNIAAADMVKNIPEVNKLRRYRKDLNSQYQEMLKGARNGSGS